MIWTSSHHNKKLLSLALTNPASNLHNYCFTKLVSGLKERDDSTYIEVLEKPITHCCGCLLREYSTLLLSLFTTDSVLTVFIICTITRSNTIVNTISWNRRRHNLRTSWIESFSLSGLRRACPAFWFRTLLWSLYRIWVTTHLYDLLRKMMLSSQKILTATGFRCKFKFFFECRDWYSLCVLYYFLLAQSRWRPYYFKNAIEDQSLLKQWVGERSINVVWSLKGSEISISIRLDRFAYLLNS